MRISLFQGLFDVTSSVEAGVGRAGCRRGSEGAGGIDETIIVGGYPGSYDRLVQVSVY